MEPRGRAAYVGELVGTLAYVMFITLVMSLYTAPDSGAAPGAAWAVVGLVHFLLLFVLIQALTVVSGAHFNPAVTVALTALRRIRPLDAGIYVVLQLVGGVCGALITRLLLTDLVNADAVAYGAPSLSDRIDGDILLGMLGEGIGAFFLVFAVVGVAYDRRLVREWAGLAVGGALALGVMVVGPLTGAGFNPARAFGPSLVAGDFGSAAAFALAYVAAPLAGGVLAAVGYRQLYVVPRRRAEPAGAGR